MNWFLIITLYFGSTPAPSVYMTSNVYGFETEEACKDFEVNYQPPPNANVEFGVCTKRRGKSLNDGEPN